MARAVFLLLIGALTGGAAVYFAAGRSADDAAALDGAGDPALPELPASREPVAAAGEPETPAASSRVAARIAIYQRAAAATDVFDLESMIDLAAGRARSVERDLELDALLARLAELDPARAVDVAQSLYLEARFFEPLYRAWAMTDADAALAAVASISSPATRRNMALALLDVFGHDDSGVARIAEELPESERVAFEADALIRRAEFDPLGALQATLGRGRSTMQQTLLLEIAETAARTDPHGALALADAIGDSNLRRLVSSRVLNAWAALDPDTVFSLIESPDFGSLESAAGAFASLAAADAERLLAAAETFPTQIRANAQHAVLSAMAETDPRGALVLLDELLPPGEDRSAGLRSIAATWAESDPDAALAWVRSLSPPSQDALTAVLQALAQVDFDRALDAVIAEVESAGSAPPGLAPSILGSNLGFTLIFALYPPGDADFGRVAERLAALDQPGAVALFRNVMSRWSSDDPTAALDWAIVNADSIDAGVFRSMASTAARENPDAAIQTLARLPTNQQQGWIEGVSQGLAMVDVDRAIDFISQYRGQPAYENAMLTVVMQAARSDPRRAAALIEASDGSPQALNAAGMLAGQWADQDPRAAIEWASGLANETARTQSMQQIAAVWAQSDAGATRSWLMGMPGGGSRDAALNGFLSATARTGTLDDTLFDAYSSDRARQQGALGVVVQLGRTDPEAAQRLLDRHITDADLRRQAERMLAQRGGLGSGGLIQPGGGIVIF